MEYLFILLYGGVAGIYSGSHSLAYLRCVLLVSSLAIGVVIVVFSFPLLWFTPSNGGSLGRRCIHFQHHRQPLPSG